MTSPSSPAPSTELSIMPGGCCGPAQASRPAKNPIADIGFDDIAYLLLKHEYPTGDWDFTDIVAVRKCLIAKATDHARMLGLDDELRQSTARPNWSDYFFGLAFVASRRSHDIHTKHGCVLVDHNHHVLGTGYNGFPHGMRDEELPTTRPEKYAWMDHSETNAIANCTKSLWDVPGGVVAYITGQPCFPCVRSLWRHNVRELNVAARCGFSPGSMLKDEDQTGLFEVLRQHTGLVLRSFTPDLNWLFDADFIRELRDWGFIR